MWARVALLHGGLTYRIQIDVSFFVRSILVQIQNCSHNTKYSGHKAEIIHKG